MVKKYNLLIFIFLIMNTIFSQEKGKQTTILDKISLNDFCIQESIFFKKNRFKIYFNKKTVFKELKVFFNDRESFYYKNQTIKSFLEKFRNNSAIDLNKTSFKFQNVFNDLACTLIERGEIILMHNNSKIETIKKIEVYEWNKYSAEKTIRYSDNLKNEFWTCELLLIEDFND